MKKIAFGARILLGLMFLAFGLNGFLQFIKQPPVSSLDSPLKERRENSPAAIVCYDRHGDETVGLHCVRPRPSGSAFLENKRGTRRRVGNSDGYENGTKGPGEREGRPKGQIGQSLKRYTCTHYDRTAG